jgi:ABC-type uncharacterized transport system ATPase subunit
LIAHGILSFHGAKDKVEIFSKGEIKTCFGKSPYPQTTLIFLDEPTSDLYLETALQVIDLITSLAGKKGQSIILATHNLAEYNVSAACCRELFSVTWIDMKFCEPPLENNSERLNAFRVVIQTSVVVESMTVRIENENTIPDVVRYAVEQSKAVLIFC